MSDSKKIRVLLWRYEKKPNWFRDFVSRCIVYFTKSDVTHVAIYVNDYVYESTGWTDRAGKFKHGARKTLWVNWLKSDPDENTMPDVYLYPLDITDQQLTYIQQWCEKTVTSKMKYNFLKLVGFIFIYGTRAFWEWLGWVPFSHELLGEVCSTYVDEAFMSAGYDLFPGRGDETTVPGDFMHSPRLVTKNSIKEQVIGWDNR